MSSRGSLVQADGGVGPLSRSAELGLSSGRGVRPDGQTCLRACGRGGVSVARSTETWRGWEAGPPALSGCRPEVGGSWELRVGVPWATCSRGTCRGDAVGSGSSGAQPCTLRVRGHSTAEWRQRP